MRRVLLCLLAFPAFALAQDPLSPATAQKLAQGSFREYLELLALPSDSAVPADIQKNADWLERAFRKRGFTVKQLENQGKPMLFAEWPKKAAGAKTVLFYMHFDAQPVVPAEWAQKSPWQPVVKKRNAAGAWEIANTDFLFQEKLDWDLRVFARCSSDDKGPIMMFLAAFDGLKEAGLDPALDVKVLLDSEEERGSLGIPAVVSANKALLRTDGIVIHDGPRRPGERPTLTFGNRGLALATLVVYGPKQPLHSGHFGNYVPNPAIRLSRLLASMKDDEGKVTIPGYYERTSLSDAEKKILAASGDDESAIRRRTGIRTAEIVGGTLQEAVQFPSLNVRGMAAASVGDKASNIIPHQAVAELDLRATPEAPPEYLFSLVKKHIEGQGYHLVQGPPTDEERAAHDKLASLKLGASQRATRTPLESPIGKWAYASLLSTFGGADPVRLRMSGGTNPSDSLVEILGAPTVSVPLVNADNNQHTFDENMRVGHYVEGIRTITGLLRSPYR